MASDERIAEAQELVSLLGGIQVRYATLLGRSDFRSALAVVTAKLAKETRGTPVAAELERAAAVLKPARSTDKGSSKPTKR